jgi:hypothetical protein
MVTVACFLFFCFIENDFITNNKDISGKESLNIEATLQNFVYESSGFI